jgi:membrane protease subunit HflK
MYLDTMQQVYGNVSKVLVDTKQGSNMLYLPLDKVMQLSAQAEPTAAVAAPAPAAVSNGSPANAGAAASRSRESDRSRDRDVR